MFLTEELGQLLAGNIGYRLLNANISILHYNWLILSAVYDKSTLEYYTNSLYLR